jgi:hypothetical protein
MPASANSDGRRSGRLPPGSGRVASRVHTAVRTSLSGTAGHQGRGPKRVAPVASSDAQRS